MHASRSKHFRRELVSDSSLYAMILGLSLGLGAAIVMASPILVVVVPAAIALLIVAYHWNSASAEAEGQFFGALAPRLGLQYMRSGALPPITPLLSAGDSREYEHVMEGPIFGRLGGPRCMLAHYRFSVVKARGETLASLAENNLPAGMIAEDFDVNATTSYDFTVSAMEIPWALDLFHGVYLRQRPQIRVAKLWDDWLERARPEDVDLESSAFEARYELKAARDQDRLALHELFSPSFIVWLTEHPLRPGFECKAGTLVVHIPGHEANADRLTLFHEASREIARRVKAAAEAPKAAVTAS